MPSLKRTIVIALAALLSIVHQATAQSVIDHIKADRYYAASNYRIYPTPDTTSLTPAPAGKKAFYISHYGRHGSRYLNSKKAYTIPYNILLKADSLGKLTPLGQNVMKQMAIIIDDCHGRWGDLSALGQQQHRDIARRMMKNFPEIFEGDAHIQARSTTVNRCMLSMGSALQQMVAINPKLRIDMDASQHDMWYMNFQDKQLRDNMMPKHAKRAFDAFALPSLYKPLLNARLFNDTAYVRKHVDEKWLNYYLLKTELIQTNTKDYERIRNSDLFTLEDLYLFWRMENANWYITYGPSLLNGGHEPYTQRNLLRKLIHDADSCMLLERPGAQLRYGHETIILPLTCLLGINGYDFQTEKLEEIEKHGWWAGQVFPMGANLQFVFYRSGINDPDIVFKVLLNEEEATLPIPTDMAPYYHWRDFKAYYLKKLDDYAKLRNEK